MKTNYADKLRDPRWQKMRLKVLNRDKWTCQCCKSKEKTLNVHHTLYCGTNPWETPMENLRTLCEECHKDEKENYKSQIEALLAELQEHGFISREIELIMGAISYMFNSSGLFKSPMEFAEYLESLSLTISRQDIKKTLKDGDLFWKSAFHNIDKIRSEDRNEK